LKWTSRTDFRQTELMCVYSTVLTRRTNLFLSVCPSFSICLPSSFSIYLHHLFFLTFILLSSPFLSPLPSPYLLFPSFYSLSSCPFLYLFFPLILPSYVFFLYI
jgi:hypothetical protein